jgi:hypothetical protein
MTVPPVQVRFQATGQEQVTAAFRNVASSGAAATRTFVEGSGRVSAFGRSSVQALNATGFAVSQLATTGQVGFKSLASSVAGFASFFGVGGLIASGVISLGLILADFWNKQRREIEETKRKAEAELTSLKQRFEQAEDTRAREADPVGAAQKELRRVSQRSVENQRRIAEIDADPEGRKTTPLATPIARRRITESRAALRAELVKQNNEDAKAIMGAANAVADAQRKVTDAAGKGTGATAGLTAGINQEVAALADAISARQATASQIQRANTLLAESRALLEKTKNATIDDTATMQARARAIQTVTTLTAAFNRTTAGTSAPATDAARALEAEIDALVQLGRQGQLSVGDLARLIELQEQFTKAVRAGTLSLEERAAASKRLAEVERGIVIPPLEVGDITETRTTKAPPPPKTLPAPKIPPVATPDVTPVTDAFGDAFSQSLQSSLAAGVTSFIASGSIEGMWNSIGGSIVAGISAVNPWLGMAAGVLQGLVGGLLGDGGSRNSNRPRPLPVDVRRVINDPNARAPRFNGGNGQPLQVIGVNSPRGQRLIGSSNRNFNRRGGR